MISKLKRSEKIALQEWQDLCERISHSTELGLNETDAEKQQRITRLKSNFQDFCKYYFPDFIDSDFGWFHKKAIKTLEQNKDVIMVLEWAREHAKSIFADVFTPMYLYANGEISGMVIVSASFDKAKGLLGDLQAQFTSNARWINDFGELAKMGDWQDGQFASSDGIGFWAFGRGQSPRGIRKGAKRPNYCVIDDIDDSEIVHNEVRVDKALGWVLKDLYNALPLHGKRIVWAGNRIHRKSILAKYVGDYDAGLEVNTTITHIKVYAVENPKTHGKADFQNGKPAWKERYTLEQLDKRRKEIGTMNFNAEFQHEHLVSGRHFKPEWWHYMKTPPLSHFDFIVNYTDSSMGAAKTSDYKASLTIGTLSAKHKYPFKYLVLDGFCRQCTNNTLAKYLFDLYERYGNNAEYWVEANKLQKHSSWKLMKQDFEAEAKKRTVIDWQPRGDSRDKPKKEMRIESLISLFERGLVAWAVEKRSSPDFQTIAEQFWAYPEGHDDAPDAFEGGYEKLKQRGNNNNRIRTGSYGNTNTRRL